jgi:hypothetical protein
VAFFSERSLVGSLGYFALFHSYCTRDLFNDFPATDVFLLLDMAVVDIGFELID